MIGVISLQVEDCQGAGNVIFVSEVMDMIEKEFKISKREKKKFRYIGVDVSREENCEIIIDQNSYKEALEEIKIDKTEDGLRDLSREEF